jgi:hypothetical protein
MSSMLAVVSVAGRPSCVAWAHAANPVRFGAHLRPFPLGLWHNDLDVASTPAPAPPVNPVVKGPAAAR